MRWEELTGDQFTEAVQKAEGVCLLPLSCIERHGHHLPLATDMYVPAFPRVAGDLSTSATQVQLTLTTFFVGMALGQLIGGPVSDQRGRRRPLLAALVLMTVASIVCALTPSIADRASPLLPSMECQNSTSVTTTSLRTTTL